MNILFALILPAIVALLTAVGMHLSGWGNFITSRSNAKQQAKNNQEIQQDRLVNEALSIATSLREQMKFMREDRADIEARHESDMKTMRGRVTELEARVNELTLKNAQLEGENVKLRAELYTLSQKQSGS